MVNVPQNLNQLDVPKEEETSDVNNSSTLVVNELSKHPENVMDAGATMVDDVYVPAVTTTSLYPTFPALAGPAGESSMVYMP